MRPKVEVTQAVTKKFLTESNLDQYVGNLFIMDDDPGYLYILAEVDNDSHNGECFAFINIRTGGRWFDPLKRDSFIQCVNEEEYALFHGVVTLSTV